MWLASATPGSFLRLSYRGYDETKFKSVMSVALGSTFGRLSSNKDSFIYFFKYMSVLPVCMFVYHMCAVPTDTRRGIGSPELFG